MSVSKSQILEHLEGFHQERDQLMRALMKVDGAIAYGEILLKVVDGEDGVPDNVVPFPANVVDEDDSYAD